MTVALTATAVSGSEVSLAYTGFPTNTTVSLYKTTNSTYGTAAEPDPDDWGTAIYSKSGSATGSFVAHGLTAGNTVYFLVTDGESSAVQSVTLSSVGEMKSDFVATELFFAETPKNMASTQNQAGWQTFSGIPLPDGKHISVVAIASANEITDTNFTSILSSASATLGVSTSFQILCNDSLPTITGYSPQLAGNVRVTYEPAT